MLLGLNEFIESYISNATIASGNYTICMHIYDAIVCLNYLISISWGSKACQVMIKAQRKDW